MNRLRRFYNQNTKLVWSVIGSIVVVIVVLQILNNITKRNLAKREEELSNSNGQYTNKSINTTNYNDISLQSQKSVLSGETISTSEQGKIDTINEFFKYLNEKEIEQAYNLLTEECKEEMYSSVEDFNEFYYKQILNETKKNVIVENWTGDIYKITINDDILSSGKYSDENVMQDYITIKQNNNNEYRLNINNYIGRNYLDEESEQQNIKIKTLQKDTYMDYTIYTFEVTNNTDNTILLDPLKDIEGVYLEDKKEVKYKYYSHELTIQQLKLVSKETKQVKIKFFNKYSSTKRITKAVFSNLILDYEEYLNSAFYNDYYKFKVEV